MSDNRNDKTGTIVSGCKQLVIEVQPGYSLPQVVGLLNHRDAMVAGEQIICYSETNSDGFWVLARIVSESGGQAQGDWRVRSDNDEHNGCACSATQEERDRNLANGIRARADQFVAEGDYVAAEALLIAVRALLDNSGGRDNEQGIWLLSSEASLMSLHKAFDRAAVHFGKALALSRQIFGLEHPATAVCMANLGETLKELGRDSEATELLTGALRILQTAQPTGVYTTEYIKGVVGEVSRLLA